MGYTWEQVVGMILGSREYRQDLVVQPYPALLHRAAESRVLNYWVNLLNLGASDQLVDSGIAGSHEYFDKAQT